MISNHLTLVCSSIQPVLKLCLHHIKFRTLSAMCWYGVASCIEPISKPVPFCVVISDCIPTANPKEIFSKFYPKLVPIPVTAPIYPEYMRHKKWLQRNRPIISAMTIPRTFPKLKELNESQKMYSTQNKMHFSIDEGLSIRFAIK